MCGLTERLEQLSCLRDLLTSSGCNTTDVACLCPSGALQRQTSLCVEGACSVKEILTTKNLTSHLCGVEVHGDGRIVPVMALSIGLAGVAVALRVLARVLTKAYFWWDDLCAMLAMGCCVAFTVLNTQATNLGMGKEIWSVPFENITAILRTFFINMLLYTTARFLIRASVILFYLRVFHLPSSNRLARILIATLIANVVYNLAFFLAVVFQCQPINFFWHLWEHDENRDGHCGNVNILAWVAAISGILFDMWLLVLPFPQLLALRLHWKKKMMGGVMLSVGIAVVIVSLVRLKTINMFTRGVNPTKDIVDVCLWSGIELNAGVICPCLPSLRLLLRRMLPRMVDTTPNYEMGTVPSTHHSVKGATAGKGMTGSPRQEGVSGGGPTQGIRVSGVESPQGSSHAGNQSCSASATALVEGNTSGEEERRN
ncbi:hypothetical protein B0T14DRAFT_417398 [Immersiella caudata]|uniref:CFEM domain-containing protein n=1 Tax=Immersiella caudata TaxID=314043 RepID=A0AA40CE63_9PEZI|nr:hypothetical protein B0T14DRAFT_417398 [Immersiella caudata]